MAHAKKFAAVLLLLGGAALLVFRLTHAGSQRGPSIEELQASADKVVSYSARCEAFVVGLTPPQSFPRDSAELPEGMKPMKVGSAIFGKGPALLRLMTEWELQGHKTAVVMTFDGRYQWAETTRTVRGKTTRAVMKLEVASLTPPDRPFDTGCWIYGCGLVAGEDLPGTVRFLLEYYDLGMVSLEKVGKVPCYVFEGRLNEDRYERLARQRFGIATSEEMTRLLEMLKANMLFARVYFAKTDLFTRKYELGAEPGEPSFVATFTDVRLNATLPEDTFTYSPPDGVVVEDVTARAKEARQRIQAGPSR